MLSVKVFKSALLLMVGDRLKTQPFQNQLELVTLNQSSVSFLYDIQPLNVPWEDF